MSTVSRRCPSSAASETPSRRALRSHSAMSIAEIAYIASPHGPALRTAASIAAQHAGMSPGSAIAGASSSLANAPAAAGAYVQPSPPSTSTTTKVVASHSNVPSDSGASVGTLNVLTASSTALLEPAAPATPRYGPGG